MVFEKTGQTGLFVKEVGALGGRGCYLLRPDTLEEKLTGQKLYERSFIHQELVKQHPAISEIYPHSINTIRIISHVDKDAQSHIISAFMRFGRGGNFIDNAKGRRHVCGHRYENGHAGRTCPSIYGSGWRVIY